MPLKIVNKAALTKDEFINRLNLKEIKHDAESSIRLALFNAARAQEKWAIDEDNY